MSLNRKIADTISSNAHLIQGEAMPPELIALCAHIENYEPLRASWDEDKFDRWLPYILFPRPALEYVHTTFSDLKKEQASLLNRRWWYFLSRREKHQVYRAPSTPPKSWRDYVASNRLDFRDGQLDDWAWDSKHTEIYGPDYQRPDPESTSRESSDDVHNSPSGKQE